jgi:hypothetical protein
VSTAVEALRTAMVAGDVEGVAGVHAPEAVLDASLPGGRRRHAGRAAVAARGGGTAPAR